MLTESQISDIHAMCGRMRVVGVKPSMIITNSATLRMADVKGTAREKKRARFWNRKRMAYFRSLGLTIETIRVPRSMIP